MRRDNSNTIGNNLAATEDIRHLWLRLGVSLRITPVEEMVLFGHNCDAATKTLRHILGEGRFTPDGDSYIPEPTVMEYNVEYGTIYESGEYDFDV